MVQILTDVIFGLVTIGLISIGGVMLYGSLYLFRQSYLIWRSNIVELADVKNSYHVEVEGQVEKSNNFKKIKAPLSGKECFAWKIKSYKEEMSNGNMTQSNRDRLRSKASHKSNFLLTDDMNYSVEVDVDGSSVNFSGGGDMIVSYDTELTDEQKDRIMNIDESATISAYQKSEENSEPEDLLKPVSRKYEEHRLEIGDDVHIFGGFGEAAINPEHDGRISKGSSLYEITKGTAKNSIKKKFISGVVVGSFGLIFASIGIFMLLALIGSTTTFI